MAGSQGDLAYPLNRFSSAAQQAMLDAQELAGEEGIGTTRQLKATVEAAFHGVSYPDAVGTEDLLLALARGERRAREALEGAGAGEEALRAAADHTGTADA